jgi:hypothetical protein
VNPSDALPVVLVADCCVPFFAGFLSAISKHLHVPNEYRAGDGGAHPAPFVRSTTCAKRSSRCGHALMPPKA